MELEKDNLNEILLTFLKFYQKSCDITKVKKIDAKKFVDQFFSFQDKKSKLLIELKKEKDRYFDHRKKYNWDHHDEAIQFLKTGKKPDNYKKNHILKMCVEELHLVLIMYDIK